MLADVVVVIHLAFVAFVVAGALLALWWRWVPWVHVPAAVWGVLIEWTGWICPLTPLENGLRQAGGEAGYTGGFVANYLLPLLYPSGLTRSLQFVLGLVVIGINVAVYGALIARRYRRKRS